jgi:hypothetical protein
MSSNINESVPATGSASTANVRANFAAAKSEIEALQARTEQVSSAEIDAGTGTTPRIWAPADVADAVANFSSGVDPTPSSSPLFRAGSVDATEITTGGIACIHAHFDDEILWSLPALYLAKDAVQCVLPFHAQHRVVLEAMPEWFQLRFRSAGGETTDTDFTTIFADPTVRLDYLQREQLRTRIYKWVRETQAQNIVTHNPWGEYGHVHHRIVSEEVQAACIAYGKSCWFNSVYIPEEAGPIPGGDDGTDYQEAILTDADYVDGRIVAADLEALKAVFDAADAAYSGSLPDTWTWYEAHPATNDGGDGYVDWMYYRAVNAGVDALSATDDADIAAYAASLSYFGCPSQVCGSYYP